MSDPNPTTPADNTTRPPLPTGYHEVARPTLPEGYHEVTPPAASVPEVPNGMKLVTLANNGAQTYQRSDEAVWLDEARGHKGDPGWKFWDPKSGAWAPAPAKPVSEMGFLESQLGPESWKQFGRTFYAGLSSPGEALGQFGHDIANMVGLESDDSYIQATNEYGEREAERQAIANTGDRLTYMMGEAIPQLAAILATRRMIPGAPVVSGAHRTGIIADIAKNVKGAQGVLPALTEAPISARVAGQLGLTAIKTPIPWATRAAAEAIAAAPTLYTTTPGTMDDRAKATAIGTIGGIGMSAFLEKAAIPGSTWLYEHVAPSLKSAVNKIQNVAEATKSKMYPEGATASFGQVTGNTNLKVAEQGAESIIGGGRVPQLAEQNAALKSALQEATAEVKPNRGSGMGYIVPGSAEAELAARTAKYGKPLNIIAETTDGAIAASRKVLTEDIATLERALAKQQAAIDESYAPIITDIDKQLANEAAGAQGNPFYIPNRAKINALTKQKEDLISAMKYETDQLAVGVDTAKKQLTQKIEATRPNNAIEQLENGLAQELKKLEGEQDPNVIAQLRRDIDSYSNPERNNSFKTLQDDKGTLFEQAKIAEQAGGSRSKELAKYYNNAAHAIQKDMENATMIADPSGELTLKYKMARTDYKKEVIPFQTTSGRDYQGTRPEARMLQGRPNMPEELANNLFAGNSPDMAKYAKRALDQKGRLAVEAETMRRIEAAAIEGDNFSPRKAVTAINNHSEFINQFFPPARRARLMGLKNAFEMMERSGQYGEVMHTGKFGSQVAHMKQLATSGIGVGAATLGAIGGSTAGVPGALTGAGVALGTIPATRVFSYLTGTKAGQTWLVNSSLMRIGSPAMVAHMRKLPGLIAAASPAVKSKAEAPPSPIIQEEEPDAAEAR